VDWTPDGSQLAAGNGLYETKNLGEILVWDLNNSLVTDPMDTSEPSASPSSFVDSGQRLGMGRSWDVSLGDLDGDGDLDAFVANDMRAEVGSEVWLNDGHGVFTQSQQELGYGMGLDLGDLDGDGDLDAFIVSWDEPGRVWLNDGIGLFAETGQNLGEKGGWDVTLGDLDRDGDLDALIAHERADTIWFNDGKGAFRASEQTLGKSYTAAASLADVDRDGDLDALTVGWSEPGRVWQNDGQGVFTDSGQTLSPGHIHMHGMTVGDLTGDGAPDTVLAGYPNQMWFNDGSGAFRESGQNLGYAAGDTAALGDLDGDGDLDIYLAVGDVGDAYDKIYLNDGQGHMKNSDLVLGKEFSTGVGLGDLDGDGDIDIFVTHGKLGQANGGGMPNEVWLNESR
jgi:hypothetical protein